MTDDDQLIASEIRAQVEKLNELLRRAVERGITVHINGNVVQLVPSALVRVTISRVL